MTTAPTTVAELRAAIADGCRQAASVYRNEPNLKGATRLADRLEQDAKRNAELSK